MGAPRVAIRFLPRQRTVITITDPDAGRNYYKAGDSFYVVFGDAKRVLDKRKDDRAAACRNEKPDFAQPFVDVMASLERR